MTDKASKTMRILKLLQEKGYATNIELNRICFRYSARLHELRKERHVIVTHRLSDSLYHYAYLGQREFGSELKKPAPRPKQRQTDQLTLL